VGQASLPAEQRLFVWFGPVGYTAVFEDTVSISLKSATLCSEALGFLERLEDRLDLLEAEELLKTNQPDKNVPYDEVLREMMNRQDES
jgi:hypothetical protein